VNTDHDFEQLHLRTRRRRRIAKRRNRRESEVSQQMLFFVIFVAHLDLFDRGLK